MILAYMLDQNNKKNETRAYNPIFYTRKRGKKINAGLPLIYLYQWLYGDMLRGGSGWPKCQEASQSRQKDVQDIPGFYGFINYLQLDAISSHFNVT